MSIIRRIVFAALLLVLTAPLGAAPATAPSPEVAALIAQLSSPDESVRKAAMEKLVGMGDQAREALEAFIKARSAADTALAQIDANKVASPTLVTLNFNAVKSDAVLADLSKQSGYELRMSNESGRPTRAPNITISLEKQPFWTAFKELATQAGITLHYESQNQHRIILAPSNQGMNFLKYPVSINGPFMVIATALSRTNSVDFSHPQTIQRNVTLQLQVLVEPKVKISQFSYNPQVLAAADDNGNSLAPPNSSNNSGTSSTRGIMWNAGVGLVYPTANPGQKITTLRGRIRTVVLTRTENFEIADVLNAKETTKTIGARRYVFKGLKKNGDRQYQVDFVAYREGMEQQAFWQMMNNPTMQLLDDKGREYFSSGGGGGGNDETYTGQMNFYNRGRSDGGVAPGEPVKLVWEVPLATQEIFIPFEFTDLPLP